MTDGISVNFTVYDEGDGRIVMSGVAQMTVLHLYPSSGQSVVVGVRGDARTHYVDLESLTLQDRPHGPTSLSDIPSPATVLVRSNALGTTDTYTVTDGSFEYSDQPGTYTITVQAWPQMDAVFEVTL